MVSTDVIIGPADELHPGAHGALLDDSPPGIRYRPLPAQHVLMLPTRRAQPYAAPELGEFVDFGAGTSVVHSEKWPVVRRRAWVAGCDDFSFPILCGRHALTTAAPRPEQPDGLRVVVRTQTTTRRAENMLRAFAHPSCAAVVFRSRFQFDMAARWLAHVGCPRDRDEFIAKSVVAYPAPRALARAEVERKWADVQRRVLFCGRDFEEKRGALALEVMATIVATEPHVVCSYVGRVPDAVAARYARLSPRLDIHQHLAHPEMLELFGRSHVLLHPSRGESPGIALLEAAAAGLALVAGCDGGMRHVRGLFGDDEDALFLEREGLAPEREVAGFARLVRIAVNDRERSRRLGLSNHSRAADGELSRTHRDRVLGNVYERARARPAKTALELQSLPWAAASVARVFTHRQMERAADRVRHAGGFAGTHVGLAFEL